MFSSNAKDHSIQFHSCLMMQQFFFLLLLRLFAILTKKKKELNTKPDGLFIVSSKTKSKENQPNMPATNKWPFFFVCLFLVVLFNDKKKSFEWEKSNIIVFIFMLKKQKTRKK